MTGERPTGERPTGAAPDPADEPGLEQPGLEQDGLEQDGLEQPVPGELAGQQGYPQVQPELPPRSRGVIGLLEENCTACMLCARECPDWCLYVESHDEVVEDPHGGRPRTRHVLDRFAIDYGLCMYCGICVEVCPFDALFWSPEFAYAETEPGELTHEQDRLRAWMWTVPPPPALDPGPDVGGVSGSS